MNPPGVSNTVPLSLSSPLEVSSDLSSPMSADISSDILILTPLRETPPLAQAVVQSDRRPSFSAPEKYERIDGTKKGTANNADALDSAIGQADAAPPELVVLEEKVSETEASASETESAADLRTAQAAHAFAHAKSEQAHRNAKCLRDCMTSVLNHLDQPCAVLDRNGVVIQWNEALAIVSRIDGGMALGKTLSALFALSERHPLVHALRQRDPAATYTPENWAIRILSGPVVFTSEMQAAQVTLIPLYHVPGSLEAIIVLIGITEHYT